MNPRTFIKGGNALFTIKNETSGNRFTYKVKKLKDKDLWFVSVLRGSDNTADYTYMGCLFGDDFRMTRNSKVGRNAPSYKAFRWVWGRILMDNVPECVSIHHKGRCGRCGRVLTVPESIESGFGPECINKIMGG